MKKLSWLLVGIFLILLLGLWAVYKNPAPKSPGDDKNQQTTEDIGLQVDAPAQNAVVGSPLTITGSATGSWYFEAQFPVELRDANDTVVAKGIAKAQSDWMTTSLVPFISTLTWTGTPATATGYLHFAPDDPSGGANPNLPELNWPINF